MALLRRLRHRGPGIGPTFARRAVLVCALSLAWAGCDPDVPEHLRPDDVLRQTLGLTDRDEVHRILLRGGEVERIEPDRVSLSPGAYVAFVSGDWRVREIRFDLDSLAPAAKAFLEDTDQVASPPMVDRDQRFVVTFAGAPHGRYPFTVEGNGRPAHGVVVVVPMP